MTLPATNLFSWHERKDEYIGTTFDVPVDHRSILFSGPTREKSKFWAITCVCVFLLLVSCKIFHDIAKPRHLQYIEHDTVNRASKPTTDGHQFSLFKK